MILRQGDNQMFEGPATTITATTIRSVVGASSATNNCSVLPFTSRLKKNNL